MNLSEAIATCRADLSVLDEKGIRYEPGNIRERISAYRVFNALPGRPG